MRENGLLAPHRVGRTEAKPHDGTIITDKVNEMWGTDMTQTITIREGRANVFVAVEHANSEAIGIHASRSANRFEALEPVRQGVHRCFGAIAPGVARGLKLRHDHGSNYMSGDFQDEIECLGIEASPSFVREPEGNGVAERFIRTLKENLLWVRTFDTIEELRAALVEFARRYNETWLVARHGYRTPAQVSQNRAAVHHRLAIMVCAFCHVAAPDQARMPILNPPAPSLIIVASVSSTLGTDTAFFRSATPYWDRRLQPRPDHRIPCTRHRSRNDVPAIMTVPLPEALIYLNNISCMP